MFSRFMLFFGSSALAMFWILALLWMADKIFAFAGAWGATMIGVAGSSLLLAALLMVMMGDDDCD